MVRMTVAAACANHQTDLYLPKAELDAIAMAHTTNALLQGRGQPGTHDTVLGSHIFAKLLAMRGSDAAPVQVPVFDKSCHQGQGDRLPEPRVVRPPVDVVIFEGWCVGFECLCENVLSEKYAEALASPEPYACTQHPIATLRTINRNLRAWKDQWYPLFDAMIQIRPKVSSGNPWDLVYPWRLEAEHKMKTANGGRGMTDEQVKEFVQRYMPSYELFCNDLQHGTLWPERTLCIDLDASRQVVGVRRA